jgi:hypothetical protein
MTTMQPPHPTSPGYMAGGISRASMSDPFYDKLRPPANETPAERDFRLADEARAKQVSDAIDEQLKLERAEQRRNKVDVKVLLLGQSESGKSTTLKRECPHSVLSVLHGGTYVRHAHRSRLRRAVGALTRTRARALAHTSRDSVAMRAPALPTTRTYIYFRSTRPPVILGKSPDRRARPALSHASPPLSLVSAA